MTHQITRRAFLQSASFAAAAAATPAFTEELPVDKVNRLGRELAIALNEYDSGRWFAKIYPSERREFAVGFRVIDTYLTPEQLLRNQIEETKTAMSAAYPDRDINCYSDLEVSEGHGTLIFVTTAAEA